MNHEAERIEEAAAREIDRLEAENEELRARIFDLESQIAADQLGCDDHSRLGSSILLYLRHLGGRCSLGLDE